MFVGGAGFGSPGIDFATQLEKHWALGEDLQTITPFVGASLRRLTAEDFIDNANFPETLDAGSPLRLLKIIGWQLFDRFEVDTMLGGARGALEQEKEVLYEEGWEQFATDWSKRSYELALLRWLICSCPRLVAA